MITMIFVAKMGVVAGSTIVGASVFNKASNGVFGYAGRLLASYAGAATGLYFGVKTANNLHHMFENAHRTVTKDEECEVKVNG